MSEATIRSGISTAIKAMTEFADADVVISEWGILDQSNLSAPYVLIEISDDFRSVQNTVTPQTTWNIPINLIERFTDWDETMVNLATRRQAIIDKINSSNIRSAGGLDGVDISEIRNDGYITPIFSRSDQEDLYEDALPIFLMQRILLICTEF